MHTFLTVVALICTAACGLLVRECVKRAGDCLDHALRAERTEARLKVARADVLALQAHVGSLEAQLHRLQGRVYRQGSNRDIAGALKASGEPDLARVGAAHELLGVGLAEPAPRTVLATHPKGCYCDTCQSGPVGRVNGESRA